MLNATVFRALCWNPYRDERALPQGCLQPGKGEGSFTRWMTKRRNARGALERKASSSWGQLRYELGRRQTCGTRHSWWREKHVQRLSWADLGASVGDGMWLSLTCARGWRVKLEPDYGRLQILDSETSDFVLLMLKAILQDHKCGSSAGWGWRGRQEAETRMQTASQRPEEERNFKKVPKGKHYFFFF